MTEWELYSVRNLKANAEGLKQCRENLLATAEDLVPITDDMPHSKDVKSRVEKLAIKILEVDAQLDKVREQIIIAIIENSVGGAAPRTRINLSLAKVTPR